MDEISDGGGDLECLRFPFIVRKLDGICPCLPWKYFRLCTQESLNFLLEVKQLKFVSAFINLFLCCVDSVKDTAVIIMEKPIQFDYKCTKCHQKILPPVYQCYEGHLLCELCSFAISSCPVCHDPLPASKRIRSIEIEKIIKQVQDHPCPYKNRGCTAEVKYDDLNDHKLDCSFA